MSTFLGFASALVPLNSSLNYLQSTYSSLLSGFTWQIVRQALIPTSIVGTATNPSYAFDLSTATIATGTVPCYLGCQTAGFIPTAMYVKASSTSTTTAPLTYTLDYSANGSSWSTLQTWTNQTGWTTSETRKHTITGATSQLYWRINVTAVQSSTTLNIVDWVLEDANGNWLVNQNFFDCIPPATETIGNSFSREVLRWRFIGNNISISSCHELLQNYPEVLTINTATAGAVTLSVTIGGSTVSFAGSAGNSYYQNLRGLYEALTTSVNANFTPWYWVWLPQLVAFNNIGILAIQKTPAMNSAPFTVANCACQVRGSSVYNTPYAQLTQFSNYLTMPIDLTNGFIYFMQVCSRGIAISHKTSSSYYSPIHACYGPNADAIAQTPTADLAPWGIPCSPIELIIGTDDVVANAGGTGYPSHWWGSMGNYGTMTIYPGQIYFNVDYSNDSASIAFGHGQYQGMMQDWDTNPFYVAGLTSQGITMAAEGMASGGDVTDAFYTIHRLSTQPAPSYVQWDPSHAYFGRYTASYLSGLDWYKYVGTAPANEQLLVGPHTDFITTIASPVASVDSSITVASTTGFPSSGWLVIDGEVIQYSGTSGGNTFTGCTRAMYNSSAWNYQNGTKVYIGAWWIFIISGLIFVGYQIPT